MDEEILNSEEESVNNYEDVNHSFIVDNTDYIEIKAYFKERIIDNKKYYQYYDSSIIDENPNLLDEVKPKMGLFKRPDYQLYYRIRTNSVIIDNKTKILYVHPTVLEDNVMKTLLFALIDHNSFRLDITEESKKTIFNKLDPVVLNGLFREFMKKFGDCFNV